MGATRRLQKELQDLKKSETPQMKCVADLCPDNQSILKWTGKLLPSKAPYDKGAFKVEINFPPEYPFKPPKVLMQTQIYHPIINAENWKPATKMEHVLVSLITLIEVPEPDHPLRSDVAQEFLKDNKKFM